MTINIQNATNVNVTGHRTSKNCKPVYCITTGEMYASATDAAEANGVCVSNISSALTGRTNVCCGKRFCYLSKMMEHLEEINQINRTNFEKAAAYDAIMAERRAKEEAEEAERRRKAEAREECERRRANLEALRLQIAEEMRLLTVAEAVCEEA